MVGNMHAQVGDTLLVEGRTVETPRRQGEILEVHGKDGTPPFVVRWDDSGHTTVLYPGPDCEVHGSEHGANGPATVGGA